MGAPVLVVASRSAHKIAELRRMAADLVESRRLELIDVTEAEARLGRTLPEVVEDAPDFAGNAEKKARAIVAETGLWALADDSGITVDALGGRPGVHSARYSGVEGPERDEANNQRLLEELAGIPDADRGAAFVCALCLAAPDGRVWHVAGECRGRIAHAPRGSEGFGYDPLFFSLEPGVDGKRTHGELSAAEKDAVSHRGRALRALREILHEAMGLG
jgi:XTP/dITP diphosphohydrolase